MGGNAFVRAQLDAVRNKQLRLLQVLPTLPDLQVAWLLLLYCASPRFNYALRTAPSTVNSLREPTWTAGPFQSNPAVNRAMSAPAASGPEFVPSSPELRSDTPRVGTHEALTVATPPFPSGEVTPGFQPCSPQNVDVCPACLDPVVPEGAGPATACRWPVCGHSYHALCLARSRAHVQRMQCALCRQGWRPAFDSDLEALCGQLGIDWHALQLHDPVPVQPPPS